MDEFVRPPRPAARQDATFEQKPVRGRPQAASQPTKRGGGGPFAFLAPPSARRMPRRRAAVRRDARSGVGRHSPANRASTGFLRGNDGGRRPQHPPAPAPRPDARTPHRDRDRRAVAATARCWQGRSAGAAAPLPSRERRELPPSKPRKRQPDARPARIGGTSPAERRARARRARLPTPAAHLRSPPRRRLDFRIAVNRRGRDIRPKGPAPPGVFTACSRTCSWCGTVFTRSSPRGVNR